MKKIIIIHHTGGWGGGTKSLIDVAEMLKGQYEVKVCVPAKFTSFIDHLHQCNIDCIAIKSKIPIITLYSGGPALISAGTLKCICSLFQIKQFCAEIESYHPDIILFNSMVMAVSAKYFSSKIVKICFDRETIVNAFGKKVYTQLLSRYMDGVTFLAEYERQKFDLTPEKTVVIPDCLPLEDVHVEPQQIARKMENLPGDRFTVLYMGGFSLIKGADLIMKAANSMDSNYEWIFAGSFLLKSLSVIRILSLIGEPKKMWRAVNLRREYHKALNKQNIFFSGNRFSISTIMNAADIIVFPSTDVHQPRPCMEAGYYKKPVIISDFPETEEFYINGYNAITFKPGSSKDLSEKIEYARLSKEKLKEMGLHNYSMSLKKHNYEKTQEKLCEFIDRIVRQKEI